MARKQEKVRKKETVERNEADDNIEEVGGRKGGVGVGGVGGGR